MSGSIQTPGELQQCILFAIDSSPHAPNRTIATNLLNTLTNTSPDGGASLCVVLLRSLFQQQEHNMLQQENVPLDQSTQVDKVVFYLLTTLQRSLSKTSREKTCIVQEQTRVELRQIIFHHILYVRGQDNLCKKTDGGHESLAPMDINERCIRFLPKYLRTKVGVVLSLLIQVDFPERWPHAFNDLIQTLGTPTELTMINLTRKDIFLRTLIGFNDEVVEKTSIERNTFLKDYIRGIPSTPQLQGAQRSLSVVPPSTTISASLMEGIYSTFHWGSPFLISKNSELRKDYIQHAHKIPILAFFVLKRYLSWLDLLLVTSDTVISSLFACLLSAGPGDPDDDEGSLTSQLAVQATECLQEIVSRGMEDEKKVEMIFGLKLLEKINQSGLNLVDVDGTHINVVIKVAELINVIGLDILSFWEDKFLCESKLDNVELESCKDINKFTTTLKLLLGLFFSCFAYDDIDVSGAVIPLASRLVMTLEVETEHKESSCGVVSDTDLRISSYIPRLLGIMYEQMKYPSDFEFDYEDEDEAEEEVYRSELRKLNQKIVRSCPELSLQFLCGTLSKVQAPLSSAATSEIEAALRLIFHYCEGVRPPPGIKVVMKNETFRSVLNALHSSDIANHPHREVLILYYDIVVRYSSIFKENPELLPNVLSSMSGDCGLQHNHPRVRSRSCYLLLKLIKSLGTVLRPYVETAVVGIQGLLSNQSSLPLHPDDSMYLFETIGLLLGKTGLEESDQQKYLTAVTTPHIQRIDAILKSSSGVQGDAESFIDILATSVAAIASLSKGFSKKASKNIQLVLGETLPVCLNVLTLFHAHAPIRNKVMVYLQRMILTLGNNILHYISNFIELLIGSCDGEDVIDVSQLLYQLCSKFKAASSTVLDSALLPFIEKCHHLVTVSNAGAITEDERIAPSHLLLEQLAVKKMTFSLLHQIVTCQCTSILLSPTNISSLERILSVMRDGAVLQDAVVKKSCLRFFKELTIQWLDKTSCPQGVSRIRVGFVNFVVQDLIPNVLKTMVAASFDHNDAMQYRSLREMSHILLNVKDSVDTDEFKQEVVAKSLMPLRCPVSIATDIEDASDAQTIEICLKDMLSKIKE